MSLTPSEVQPEKTMERARGGRLTKLHDRKLAHLFEKHGFKPWLVGERVGLVGNGVEGGGGGHGSENKPA